MTHDLAVVGAGTAGAALAAFAARAGLDVVCLERRPLDDAGARWVNLLPRWMFAEAGVALPRGDELLGAGHAFHFVAGTGPERVVVPEHDLVEVDMRLLVRRLHDDAQRAGADLRGPVHVHGISGETLETSAGPVRARWIADASGLAGARLLGQPAARGADLCAAAQEVRRVRDPAGASAFLAAQGLAPGDTISFGGVAGGFSVVNVRVHEDRVSLLTGSVPALGHPPGSRLLAQFVASHPWIGERLFGGARAIPLAPHPGPLARGSVALLGDAGGQVFSAHGSGIGLGLIAARELSLSLVRGDGASGYARRFRRRWAPLLWTYDVLRRASQRLGPRQIAWMIRAGLMDRQTVRAALEQRLPPGPTWLRRSRP